MPFHAKDKKVHDETVQGYSQWKINPPLTGNTTSFAP
jgi:hypothetical protein